MTYTVCKWIPVADKDAIEWHRNNGWRVNSTAGHHSTYSVLVTKEDGETNGCDGTTED